MKAPKGQKAPEVEKASGRETRLDEALEGTFPASDPVALGHSDHVGGPPNHKAARRKHPS
ncbi:hypothetical protein [Microvirga alba]|uniref:Uncharacterized protein n=1 Tax=Microvirga alba TaxID=2791025 RepID=A0A931FNK0_9HYPH|nr:hypothetical protein [Microvirga alba]MBF9232402.1 hypothetical protein [Microvirga alba]